MFLERFMQDKYGKTIHDGNISAWRRAISGDLNSAFRPYDPKQDPLDFLNRNKFVVGIEKARYKEIPSNYAKLTADQIEQINRSPRHSELMPHQEEGISPSCALPYELYADGCLAADGKSYEIRLSAGNQLYGAKAAGAPFNIYLRNTKHENAAHSPTVATYAVKAGDRLTPQYPVADSGYAIEVHGPNGFYRSFTGGAASHPVEVRTSYERKGNEFTGNVLVLLRSTAERPVSIEIKDNAYKAKPVTRTIEPHKEISVVLPLKQSHNWYDFTVKASGSDAEARFAGRVETGRAGFSDPVMGGMA